MRKIKAYATENVHLWSETVHSEVIMHPPWDMLMGRDTSKKSVNVYFQVCELHLAAIYRTNELFTELFAHADHAVAADG